MDMPMPGLHAAEEIEAQRRRPDMQHEPEPL
jgi:hypothetical protein